MKLKNKKTGEMATLTLSSNGEELLLMKNNELVTHNVKLSDLEEWEDAPEEPKEHWYISDNGDVSSFSYYYLGSEIEESHREIGNYFETKEEAELAVRKLKAWKRLKDKGFRVTGYSRYDWNGDESPAIAFEYSDFDKMFDDKRVVADLDICFGGEE